MSLSSFRAAVSFFVLSCSPAFGDTSPNSFSFVDQANVAPGTVVTSRPIVINGINQPAPVSISGGSYSIGCGPDGSYTAAAGSVTVKQRICVRHTASAAFSAATDTVLSVGGQSDTFTSTTAAQDTTPTALLLVDRTGVVAGSIVTSRAIRISGTNAPAPISVTGGSYSINCLANGYTTAPGNVAPGSTVCLRHVAGASAGAAVTTRLTVGGVFDNFSSVVADPAAASTSVRAVATGNNTLRVINPARPSSAANPLVLDTVTTDALGETGTVFLGSTVNGTAFTGARVARYAYVKGGRLFAMNLTGGANNNPFAVSSLTDVCTIEESVLDFSNPDNSWMRVRRAGANGQCDLLDDVQTLVRLRAGSADAGVTPIDLRRVLPVFNASAAITGFLSLEGAPLNLVRRDAAFANPVVLLQVGGGLGSNAESDLSYFARDTRQNYLALQSGGTNDYELFRYDNASGVLSEPLYGFVGGVPCLECGTFDADNLYFVDGKRVVRIAHTGIEASVVTELFGLGSGGVGRVVLGSGSNSRLVFSYFGGGGATPSGVYSVPKTGTDAESTLLQASGFANGEFTFASLVTVVASGVYINVARSDDSGETFSALRIQPDGSAPLALENASWAGGSYPENLDLVTANTFDGGAAQRILRMSQSGGVGTLETIDPATGAVLLNLGSIAGVSSVGNTFGFGLGRYVELQVKIDRGNGSSDDDAYVADTLTAGSLRPVAALQGRRDFPLGF